jgi:hypothetical protein
MKWRLRSLKAGDFVAIGIAVILLISGIYAVANNLNAPRQRPYHSNFGPDWDCYSPRGAMCIKRPHAPIPLPN